MTPPNVAVSGRGERMRASGPLQRGSWTPCGQRGICLYKREGGAPSAGSAELEFCLLHQVVQLMVQTGLIGNKTDREDG